MKDHGRVDIVKWLADLRFTDVYGTLGAAAHSRYPIVQREAV